MRTSWRRLIVALLAACFGLPALAHRQSSDAHIAPEAIAEIAALIAQKHHRTAGEAKLDSNLLFAARAEMTRRLGSIESLPPYIDTFIESHVAAADRSVAVSIRAAVSADLIAALARSGATDITPFAAFDAVTARLPIAALEAIAQRADVRFVAPLEAPYNSGVEPSSQEQTITKASLQPPAKNAVVVSEGVKAHQADKAIETGIDGTGVLVCVISDGIDSLPARQATGAMPPVVTFGQIGSGDRGTAMLKVIHDMAPGALLGFASGLSETQMANVIDGMRPAGCGIIVDDVVWPSEGTYDEGPIALAISAFTGTGGLYVSAAGDHGSAMHATSSTWEGDFVDSGAVYAAVTAFEGQTVKIHRFGSSSFNTLLASPGVLSLKWSDPLGAASNDYDLFVLDASGTAILASSTTVQSGSQDPVETIACTPATCPTGAIVVVALHSGAPRALRLQAFGSPTGAKLSTTTSGNTFGHSARADVVTIGAIDVANASGGAFTGGTNVAVEGASADGRRHLFYQLDGSAITPGNVLFGTGGGESLAKVDLAAADNVTTGVTGYSPYGGTSAAAAHAAAIAALVRSANRSASPEVIKNALVASALDIEAAGNDVDSGAGIVMAPAALRLVLAPLGVGRNFATAQIAAKGTSTLTVTITNSNATRLAGISFTDTYPPSIVNASSPAAQVSGAGCGGTLAAAPGGGSLTLSGGVVPAFATCTITVTVTGNAANVYVDSSGTLTTPIGLNTKLATAMLTIAAAPPTLQGAASRKLHGASGTFDLPLSRIAQSPTVEPRLGANASIVFTFDKPVGGASVAVTEGTAIAAAPQFNGNTLVVNLSGVADGQYVTVALTNVTSADGGSGGGASIRIGFLAGDVDGSRAVTLSDLLSLNAVLAQAVTANNYLRDVNASGSFSIGDVLVVNAGLAHALPAP